MKRLDVRAAARWHGASSLGTLALALWLAAACLDPALVPDLYRIITDERITLAVPYLLVLALGSSLVSLWFFRTDPARRRS